MNKIQCKSCGAILEESLEACPYCGSTNLSGAEKAYMGRLEKIKAGLSRLTQMDEIHKQIYKRECKMIGITILVTFLIIGSIYVFSKADENKMNRELREQILSEMGVE